MNLGAAVFPLVSIASLPCSSRARAQTQIPTRTPTIDQSLEVHSVASPQISPDGTRVVYEQSRTNWEANAFDTDLWLADAATGQRHPLTVMAKSSTNAKWSPDGRWIAFLSDRPAPIAGSPADKKQIYVMPADGGEAQQLTKMEKGVNAFDWAPDSTKIAIAAAAPDTKAMKDRKESFGDYHVFHADYEMAHLWLVDLPKTDAAGRTAPAAEPKLSPPAIPSASQAASPSRPTEPTLPSARNAIPTSFPPSARISTPSTSLMAR